MLKSGTYFLGRYRCYAIMLHIPLASPLRGQMEDAQAFMTNTTDDESILVLRKQGI